MELVSILIPNFNYGHYIRKTLESAVNQTYSNIEIIVCDNCSTDNSVEIIKEYENRYSNVKLYVNSENIGTSANAEKCLLLSKGDYLVFPSSDDYLDINFVGECIKNLKKYPTAAFAITDKFLVNEDNDIIDTPSFYEKSFFSKGIYHNKIMLMTNPFSFSYTLLKRECLLDPRINFLKNKTNSAWEDAEYFFKLGMVYDLVYIKKKLAYYRVHTGSYSRTYDSFSYIFQHYLHQQKILELAKKHEYLNQFIEDASKRTNHFCVRVIKQLLEINNFQWAKNHLDLLKIFDEKIVNFIYYKLVNNIISSETYEHTNAFEKAEIEYLLSLQTSTEGRPGAPYELPEFATVIDD